MNDGTRPEEGQAPTRRDLLRRSALLGGAVVWTTPVVQSLSAPAFATGSPVQENPCEHRFFVKYELQERRFETSDGDCNSAVTECGQSGTIAVVDAGGGTAEIWLKNGPRIGSLVATNVSSSCIDLDFTFTNGCNVDESSTYVVYKTGQKFGGCVGDQEGQLSDTSLDNPALDKYRICTTGGTGLSHVDLCVCLQCPST